MSNNDIAVFPGMSIRGENNKSPTFPGRIGYYAYSEKRKCVVGLTAAQVGNAPQIYAVSNHTDSLEEGKFIARGWEPDDRDRTFTLMAPASQLIHRVTIRSDIKNLNPECANDLLNNIDLKDPPEDYRGFLNSEVFITNDDQEVRCTLVSLDGIFKMRSSIVEDSNIQIFTSAIEIRPRHDQKFDFDGMPGSLVFSQGGECLGIIVSGNETILFAAPLNEFLLEKDLKPLSKAQIEEYFALAKENANAPRQVEPSILIPPQVFSDLKDNTELIDEQRAIEATAILDEWGDVG